MTSAPQHPRATPLARSLIISTILASSLITLVLTGVQLYRTYRIERDDIEQRLQQVKVVHLPSITEALWATDTDVLRAQVRGILALPDVSHVVLREGEEIWAEAGQPGAEAALRLEIPVIRRSAGEERHIGTLSVEATLDGVYARLLDQALVVLISNALKTFLVAGFMYWLINRIVLRPLASLTAYLGEATSQRRGARWQPGARAPAEFATVAQALARLQHEVETSFDAERAAEARYRTLFEQANDGIALFEPANGRIVDANQRFADIVGHPLETLRNMTMFDLGTPENQDETRRRIHAIIEHGSDVSERQLVGPDGRARTLEVSARLFDNAGDRLIVSFVRDLTERNRTRAELERANRELRDLTHRLVAAQEDERRHISRELHDEIGQLLTAIGINLGLVRSAPEGDDAGQLLDECRLEIEQAITRVRDLSLDLRPSMLEDLGLVATIEWYLARVAGRVGIAVETDADLGDNVLSETVTLAAFRIIQESTTNLLRHANARRVAVWMRVEDGALRLAVRDDGDGFDTGSAGPGGRGGLGLTGMRERAALVGGSLEIRSVLGAGTEIRASLPLAD